MRYHMFTFTCFLVALSALGSERTLTVNPETSLIRAHAKATGHSFEAVVTAFTSQVSVDSETGTPLKAEIAFSVLNLDTDNAKRDKEMLHWIDNDHFPQIQFHFKDWKNSSKSVALGRLSIHGVEKEVELPLTFRKVDNKVVIEGSCVINTTDFGLEIIKKMFILKVDPALNIEFRLEGTVAP